MSRSESVGGTCGEGVADTWESMRQQRTSV